MKKALLMTLLMAACLAAGAQKSDYPLIGAQVFVENGQTPAQIENRFKILHDNGMEVCRIRLFEVYEKDAQGNWDFSLFDTAFNAAARYGVKIFATLFPSDAGEDNVAGMKVPKNEKHLAKIAEYIKATVTHFKDHPALYCWVLQNEPGGGSITSLTDYYSKVFDRWKQSQPAPAYNSNGFLTADFGYQQFRRYMLVDYLGWIAQQVRKYDTKTYLHVNPHQIFSLLPEYDFHGMSKFLSSLGASMHPAHHFYIFNRNEYTLGIAINSEIIRNGAIQNPFWITELQGGNNLYSGRDPMCPTSQEIEQWLWTGIMAGAQGAIFWSLNSRASLKEAGEWALLTLQDEPSDRMKAATAVVKSVLGNKAFFKGAEPVQSNITLMYNYESYFVQGVQSGKRIGNDVRESDGCITALVSDYKALTECGVEPGIAAMDIYNWEKEPAGDVIVLPNMVSLPSYDWEKLKDFVKRGGKLVMTSMTGFFDENAHCIAMGDHPLKEMLGGNFSEYKMIAESFDQNFGGMVMPVRYWKGVIRNYTGTVLAEDADGALMTSNKYGKGTVVWCPSMIDNGAWHADNKPLRRFMEKYVIGNAKERMPVTFSGEQDGVLLKSLRSGKQLMTFVCNKGATAAAIDLSAGKLSPTTVYGSAKVVGSKLNLAPEESVVILWK